jgi:TolA-binding protein
MMMLACLGSGDYTGAEGWGHQALDECRKGSPDDDTIRGLLAKGEKLDMAVAQLMARVRGESAGSSAAPMVLEQAINICTACTTLGLSGSNAGEITGGVQSLYARTKKRHIARVLTAEHRYARQRLLGSEMAEHSSGLDPLLFAAQVLSEDSFDRIKENLASASDEERDEDRMYRFAVFTHRIDRLDLTRSALDAVAGEQASASSAEILEDVARMYLATSSHQKAIDIYERIARNSQDPSRAKTAQLKIIDIYAEDLQRYDKAIQECEEFMRTYPDSPQATEVEFLIGKLAYLKKDYPGTVGQLDGFRKRYPEHPQVGQAMMLAALSQMAEGSNDDAINRFKETIRRYPDGNLAARSKFLIGYAQVSGQQYHAALETFKQLLEQFPQSQYVPQARSLIDRLNKVSQ